MRKSFAFDQKIKILKGLGFDGMQFHDDGCKGPESCILLASLPVFHSFGCTVTLWYPMFRGCRVVSVPTSGSRR